MTQENLIPGGYSPKRALNKHDKEVFTKAMANFVGACYSPTEVATQVVAGTNYRFYCLYQPVVPNPVNGHAIVTIFEELPVYGGKVVITDILTF